MLDLTRYREKKIAPRAVFDALPERRTRVRFMIEEGGDYRAITWGGFARDIRNVALFLAASGLVKGDRAAIFAPNRVEWMSAALGIQAAGGVMVPIYPASTAAQAAYVAKHSDARVVFLDTKALLAKVIDAITEYENVERFVLLDDSLDVAAAIADARAAGRDVPPSLEIEQRFVPWTKALSIGASADGGSRFEDRMASVGLDDVGIMLYTSGTTGHPKGVPLTHANVAVNGEDWLTVNAPLLSEGMVDLLWLPMSHVFGFGEACLGNTLGFTTYLTEPHKVLASLPDVRPDVFMSVPAYWEKLAKMAGERPERLRELTGGHLAFCLSGGAGLSRDVKEFFRSAGLLIIEGYGLTECSPTLTMNRHDAFRFDSVGKPFPSVTVRLAEDGEILAKGPSVFRGYHKDEAATRDVFTDDGWFKTGDVGRFTEDGFLQIIDRKKEILVTAGGKNVPPQNIEVRFRDFPFVEHVVVYGDGKKYLVAGVWANANVEGGTGEGIEARVARAVEAVNKELASFEQLKRFRVMTAPLTVESGLLTSTLKIKRKKVYETFKSEFESLYEGAP